MMGVFQTRKDRDSDKTIYSHFQTVNQDTERFSLSPLPLKEAPESNASCWLSLLHGGVISHGFPIPQRGNDVGVEMSLAAISPLASIQYPVNIKGFCPFTQSLQRYKRSITVIQFSLIPVVLGSVAEALRMGHGGHGGHD